MSYERQSPMEQLFGRKGGAPPNTTKNNNHHPSSCPSPGTSSGRNPHHSPHTPEAGGGSGKRRRHKAGKKAAVAPGTPQTPPAKRPPQTNQNLSAAAPPTAHYSASTTNSKLAVPALMSILVTRTDLFDEFAQQRLQQQQQQQQQHDGNCDRMDVEESPVVAPSTPAPGLDYPRPPVAEFRYVKNPTIQSTAMHSNRDNNYEDRANAIPVAVVRVPPSTSSVPPPPMLSPFPNSSNSINPVQSLEQQQPPPSLDPSIKKYWKQRHRLFHRFDQGIQLDEEGWFSVTPEQIALHVASRMVDLFRHNHSATTGEPLTMTVLDAFGGCGGNALALAQHPAVAQVICVDIDRSKLQRAAQNAAIYQIPPHKIVFVECNVIFVLEYCYANGIFQLDQPIDSPEVAMAMMAAMPPPVATEMVLGYQIGGIDILPRRIDAVFLDPPWGGVDYEVFGKQGYCLERNMLIPRPAYQQQQQHAQEGVGDAFFDSFVTSPHHAPRNKQERKAAFNCGLDATNCVNGAELLALAAQAAPIAVYDIPRNTSRQSLGQAALQAGYRGNGKLEEHYLNGRLKTVTAYFGRDWRDELLR